MSKQFTTTVYPSITLGGNELNLIAEVRFTHVPAIRETGPTYDSGGEPGEPEGVEDVEVVRLLIDGASADANLILSPPKWLTEWIEQNVDEDELLAAVDDDGPDPDDARDRAIDDALTDRANGWED